MALNDYDIPAIQQEINRAPRAKARKCPIWCPEHHPYMAIPCPTGLYNTPPRPP
ncbi:hypothetical protein N7516_009439 [Penicillium verrucosum]|uniref:uncharacterized protein n=1 Tax=Penicillium verrucosum TaxID=60171 RepID=UPI002544D91F|nr:uncharacterized protein N7516_009439 [Penicillium verrucosum]KAJ5927666.1 hypothetical protein N7516_009439 [Penicillium verrucosum]